jgi:hypothetical protein
MVNKMSGLSQNICWAIVLLGASRSSLSRRNGACGQSLSMVVAGFGSLNNHTRVVLLGIRDLGVTVHGQVASTTRAKGSVGIVVILAKGQ